MSKRISTPLDDNWTFKQADDEASKFLPVAQFPTNVHLDLIAHGIIADPFIGKNENDIQWVGEVPWVYRTTFSTTSLFQDGEHAVKAVLAFGGLDTFSTVVLNGIEILKTENMFIPERVDVTKLLSKEVDNVLEITFESAYLKGCELIEKYPDHHWGCWNGDTSRLAVRKAQYHWGWDWGPMLMTCGPWRPVSLEVYSSRISDLYFSSSVDSSLKVAQLVAKADIEGTAEVVKFGIFLKNKPVSTQIVKVAKSHATHTFDIFDPALWYPKPYGEQPLYTLTATVLHNSTELDIQSKKFGLRRGELIQRAMIDQPGTSFSFQVNNIPIFCGGSNWIPADNFIPRISKEKYHDWVKLVADGNQFMIRVWGGGIYEEQAFYDACDEAGILVWQDFMFGCGNYPAFPDILKSIKREAEENVKLLRHHPSIIIWAGNNEDYQYQESNSLTYDFENKDSESWLKTDFPARYIYEKILADACSTLIPETYYHFGSPWSGKDTTDPTIGDLHQWNVWHGSQEKYQDFDKLLGRFVSEFGMEAFPNIKTIDYFLPLGKDDPERYPQSSTIDFHNKAAGHERRIALYLVENFRYAPEPIEQFIYATQLMQAECLASAYRLWKRQWKGPGKEYCGGALVWQINDCWPVTSWAIIHGSRGPSVDYFLRPKHAYFTVKREMAPISLGVTRKEHLTPKDKHTRAYITKTTQIEIWGSNLTLKDITGDVIVKAFDVITGKETYSKTLESNFCLPENRSTEVVAMDVPVTKKDACEEGRTVVAAYLFQSGKQIARYVNWPEPLKYVHLQKPKHLSFDLSEDGNMVEIGSDVPVKGLALECDEEGVTFGDNLVDIVPGEVVSIPVTGAAKGTSFLVRYLN
ncbi:glycoside hydrolase superfamily [Calycina marina]|uniref:Beta-mannosidase B n=1 Tax=Calycina marina TaxID=1763456 RepID=A0A9P8CC07_9HELO|nr:glycoside hydrolase superfamily [Calycina marina]